MKIVITGKHINVGENLENFAKEEIKKLMDFYVGSFLEAKVSIGKETHLFVADISIHISRNFFVCSQGKHEDAYKCVELALSKVESRVKRHKSRLRSLKRNRDEKEFTKIKHYEIQAPQEDRGDDHPLIIAEKQGEISLLTVSEAVMKMDVAHLNLLVFKNVQNQTINVVYRREDGNIGWIDPHA